MDVAAFLGGEFKAHQEVAASTLDAVAEPFEALLGACVASFRAGGKILFLGNGGSAADAQHLATELVVRFRRDREPIAALALTTDSSLLTAAGNDLGYDNVFARQVQALATDADVVIGISTSGNSENVVRALAAARAIGAVAAAFTGDGGGRLSTVADPLIAIPATDTARIQEMHIAVGHMLCAALETELGLVSE